MDLGLRNRVALVTGAGQGIGAAIATTLAAEGCHVGLVDLSEDGPVATVAGTISAMGVRSLVLGCDVRDPVATRAAVERVAGELGGLHVVVCNAGITNDAVSWKLSDEAWNDVLAVSLTGCFNVVRAAVPILRTEGWGRVVATASINGLRGKFGQANYAASKAGLIGLVKTLARETGAFGVTVNAVAPGMVLTDLTGQLPPQALEGARGETAVGRLTEPNDVANAVAFLCSDAAACITGETLRVDAGQYI
jgi:NAD(P)-dependent dehydrogenase (short-subunit alcohol dehydrogenase family)